MTEILQDNLFFQFAGVVLLAAILGAIGVFLRQPLVVTFIAVGIVAGPSVLGLVDHSEQIHLLAEMGISLLLFVVGLKLDIKLIRTMGPVALATGLGQVVFTTVFGYGIARLLGLAHLNALYVAIALTFSSTIIIIKLLSDKRELDSLHGRIATGFLIVQDIVVVIALILLSASGAGNDDATLLRQIGEVAVKGALFMAGIALLMRYGLPTFLRQVARSVELLLLFGIAWAFALAAIGDLLGFSKEVGAFLAGVSVASTPYREAMASRLVGVRDFLLLFFFINLGSGLDLHLLGQQVTGAVVLSLFVLIGNPVIVMVIMGAMGYRRRTGFLAGLTVAQISEFSFVLMALGFALGHVTEQDVGLVTLVGLITIGLSTYMILYSRFLYERLSPMLKIFERETPHREQREDQMKAGEDADIILFGIGRFGSTITDGLQKVGLRVLGVDFDPVAVRQCHALDYSVRYGDATDPEFVASLPLERARWVVSTVPDRELNAVLMNSLREIGFEGGIAVTAHDDSDAAWLKARGAHEVLMPYRDAGAEAAHRLHEAMLAQAR